MLKKKLSQISGLRNYHKADRSGWSLGDFIQEGTQISWKVQETEISDLSDKLMKAGKKEQSEKIEVYDHSKGIPTIETDEQFIVPEIHDHFIIWYLELKKFLFEKGYFNETHPSYLQATQILEAGSVPRILPNAIIIYGVDYGDLNSIKSKTLLKNIREETKKILKILRNSIENEKVADNSPLTLNNEKEIQKLPIKGKMIIEVAGKIGKFSFNQETGSVIFNELKFNFPPEQQKFKILKIIMTSPDNQGTYKMICRDLLLKEGSTSSRKINSVMKGIKKDLKILPKSKESMPDIFRSVPIIGYRLALD